MKKNYCITRFDYQRLDKITKGWFVRIVRNNHLHSKFFSDNVHGGKQKAFQMASSHRDKLLKTLGPPRKSSKEFPPKLGTIQRKTYDYVARDGYYYEYEAFSAWIRISPTQIKQTKWSINKWGVIEARKRVSKWLEKQRRIQAKNYSIKS